MFMKHIQIPVRNFYICIIVSIWGNRKIMYIATTFYGKRKVHCCHHPYHSCYKEGNYDYSYTGQPTKISANHMQTGQNPFLCFLVKTHRYHMFNKLVYYHPTFSLKSKSGRYRYFPIIDRTQLLLIFLSVLIYLSSVAYTLLSLHSGRIPLFRRYY